MAPTLNESWVCITRSCFKSLGRGEGGSVGRHDDWGICEGAIGWNISWAKWCYVCCNCGCMADYDIDHYIYSSRQAAEEAIISPGTPAMADCGQFPILGWSSAAQNTPKTSDQVWRVHVPPLRYVCVGSTCTTQLTWLKKSVVLSSLNLLQWTSLYIFFSVLSLLNPSSRCKHGGVIHSLGKSVACYCYIGMRTRSTR